MAADAIGRLREQGLEPSLDDIACLIELARRIQEPANRTDPWLSYAGIRAGDTEHVFRPLSIKAGMWFDWIEDKLPDNLKLIATGFAMEHGQMPEVDFTLLYSERAALTALDEYTNSLTCTIEEMENAVIRCMDETLEADRLMAEKHKDQAAPEIQDTIAQLVAVTGIPEERWMSRTFDYSLRVLTHSLRHKAGAFGGDVNVGDMQYQRRNFEFIAELERIERELKETAHAE